MKISSIKYHINNGTFFKAAKAKISQQFGGKSERPMARWDVNSREEAIHFLSEKVAHIASKTSGKKVIVIAEAGEMQDAFAVSLNAKSISHESYGIKEFFLLQPESLSAVSCFVSTYFDAENTMRIGKWLVSNDKTREIPFEFILIPQEDFRRVQKLDRYREDSFTSPLFRGPIDFISIYEESLMHFQQKCDIRDYMDLCQALMHVAKNNIPGDVAEFGSYRGHSGYLITQTLNQLNLKKKILLFDMFEEFPAEGLGIDYFWEEHTVNYEEVKNKFEGFSNVELVKGDFTQTILNYPDIKLSFVYMDCDSYRSTKFLTEHLFENHLSRGGLIVFEDYGHPALLGNRLAFHEFFDRRSDCFTFYSQFSGFYVVLKTGQTN